MIEKNREYIVDIIDNGCEGEGIAKIDDFTIFIPEAIAGERCKILIVKIAKSYAYGKLIEVIQESDKRKVPDCATYKRCGGCSLRHIDYSYTLKMKQAIVKNLIDKNLKTKVEVLPTIGMDNPFHYRNKLQYPVGFNTKQEKVMGVFAKRTHEIIPIRNCFIQNEEAENIAKVIFEYIKQHNISVYDEQKRKGQIRHIVIKIGIQTNEVMCIIVTNEEEIIQQEDLIKTLVKKFPNIKTIIKNINNKNTNVILGDTNIVLYGDGYIYDKLGDYTFKISPMSFYQTNPIQTEILYQKAIEYGNLRKEDVLCDLYCGIGTIGIFASSYVKQVYGIEIVPEAIEAAKENAKINQINNIEFMVGDVEKTFDIMLQDKKISPTVIFVDPPRKGLDENTIHKILELETQRVVYISCNPATMVRDLAKLEEKYHIQPIQPVDMFPFTNGIESITVLILK